MFLVDNRNSLIRCPHGISVSTKVYGLVGPWFKPHWSSHNMQRKLCIVIPLIIVLRGQKSSWSLAPMGLNYSCSGPAWLGNLP